MRSITALALLAGQMLIYPAAAMACQAVQCLLPGDLILSSPLDFTNDPGRIIEQAGSALKESSHNHPFEVFMTITGSRSDRSDTVDEDGYSARSHAIQFGGLREIAKDTLLAYSLAYEEARQAGNDGLANTDSRLYHAGAALEHQWGNWRANGSIGLGYGRHQATRQIAPERASSTGRARFGSYYGVLGTGVSYLAQGANWYVEPSLGLALVYQYTPGYREHGLGAKSLTVHRAQDLKTVLTPAVEFGKALELDQATLLYWFSAGVNLLPDHTWSSRSHAEGEPGVTLTEQAKMPAAIGDFRAGVSFANHKGWSAHAEYALQIASHYRNQTGTLRWMLAF